ncbi:MAG: hypothetical protein ACLFWM_12125 [Actinomycetota bacterium]
MESHTARQHIDVEIEAHIGTVPLNRPPVNAQNRALREELISAFDDINGNATRRLSYSEDVGHRLGAPGDIRLDGVGQRVHAG